MNQGRLTRKLVRLLPELGVLCLYMVLLGLTLWRHEPWFDEAQAWLMARDLSYHDLVFQWMRYEGHLPLWHLLLSIPAKTGVPYELGLKSVEFLCASAAAAVFLVRAPFPRVVKLILPFTYFLFYQYGVISRCYSLLMLAMWLTAAAYPTRHEHPGRFVLALSFVGGTTAYGMLIAFSVAVMWFLEMIRETRSKGAGISRLLKDRRTAWLVVLAVVHLFYLFLLWPPADRFTPGVENATLVTRFAQTVLAPLEASAFDISHQDSADSISGMYVIACLTVLLIFGVVMWRRRKLLYAGLMIGVLLLFSFLQYFSIHHSGILTLVAIYLMWITEKPAEQALPSTVSPWHTKEKLLGKVLVGAVLAIQFFWSAYATISDLQYPYDSSRQMAGFLQQNRVEQYSVFGAYRSFVQGDRACFLVDNTVLPYFKENIFVNLNNGNRALSAIEHRAIPYSSTAPPMQWTGEAPDFVLTSSEGILPFHTVLPIERYVKVAAFYGTHFWKADLSLPIPQSAVYLREDLLPRFANLHPIADLPLDQYKSMVSSAQQGGGE